MQAVQNTQRPIIIEQMWGESNPDANLGEKVALYVQRFFAIIGYVALSVATFFVLPLCDLVDFFENKKTENVIIELLKKPI